MHNDCSNVFHHARSYSVSIINRTFVIGALKQHLRYHLEKLAEEVSTYSTCVDSWLSRINNPQAFYRIKAGIFVMCQGII